MKAGGRVGHRFTGRGARRGQAGRREGRTGGAGPHPEGSAGRWCAAPGSRSAAPARPGALCPGCRSCTRRHRPAPRGAPVRLSPLRPGTCPPTCFLLIPPSRRVQGKRPGPLHAPTYPSSPPPAATTFRACSSPRQASLRKVKDLAGGTSWMAARRFRKFTANSCAQGWGQ